MVVATMDINMLYGRHNMTNPQLELLTPDNSKYYVIAPDLPEFGQTTKPAVSAHETEDK